MDGADRVRDGAGRSIVQRPGELPGQERWAAWMSWLTGMRVAPALRTAMDAADG